MLLPASAVPMLMSPRELKVRITGNSTDATLAPAQVLTITDSLPPTLPALLRNPVLLTCVGFSASRKDALQVVLKGVPYSEVICWRPPLLPRPKVTGTMTGRVTSAKEGDIYAWQDASGMYRVKFDADRDDKNPGQESMPVRLAKPYSGDAYGFHFPLIQGTEVAIAFEEGDPDRPYIAHALHDSRHVDHVTDKNGTRDYGSLTAAGLGQEWYGFGQTVFVRPMEQAWQQVLTPAAESLNTRWRTAVVDGWNNAFSGRYPFKNVSSDASLPLLAKYGASTDARAFRCSAEV